MWQLQHRQGNKHLLGCCAFSLQWGARQRPAVTQTLAVIFFYGIVTIRLFLKSFVSLNYLIKPCT